MYLCVDIGVGDKMFCGIKLKASMEDGNREITSVVFGLTYRQQVKGESTPDHQVLHARNFHSGKESLGGKNEKQTIVRASAPNQAEQILINR